MINHTESPWEYRGRRVSGRNGEIICEIEQHNKERAGNAALIAVAPAMAEILEEMNDTFNAGISCHFAPDCAMAGKIRAILEVL